MWFCRGESVTRPDLYPPITPMGTGQNTSDIETCQVSQNLTGLLLPALCASVFLCVSAFPPWRPFKQYNNHRNVRLLG